MISEFDSRLELLLRLRLDLVLKKIKSILDCCLFETMFCGHPIGATLLCTGQKITTAAVCYDHRVREILLDSWVSEE